MIACGLRAQGCAARALQRGQAVLFIVLVLGIGIGAFTYGALSFVARDQRQDVKIRQALVEARDALIGRAAADDNRPGSLPCPDTDDDGVAELFAGNDCPSYLGRLPWRTLGLPDLRDSSGERLWYALSSRFRDHTTAEPINSDTKGNLTVYAESTASVLTGEAVAVLFAPGAALGAQIRDATAALCPTTGATIARNLCAANYLDSAGGINNATPNANPPPNPSFIAAQGSGSFNDRLLVVTTSELMRPVESRVARELRAILQSYKTATAALGYNGGAGVYPWADLSDGYSDAPPYEAPGVGRNRGRIPALGAAPRNWGDPGPPAVPALPAWFVANDWRVVVHYSAGQNFLETGGCSTCVNPTLSVDGGSGKEVVILMPGPADAKRPAPVPLSDPTYWQYYLEDGANNDASDDLYATPSSTAYTRDRIYTIP